MAVVPLVGESDGLSAASGLLATVHFVGVVGGLSGGLGSPSKTIALTGQAGDFSGTNSLLGSSLASITGAAVGASVAVAHLTVSTSVALVGRSAGRSVEAATIFVASGGGGGGIVPSATQRWRFDDPTDLSHYTFEVNPNKGGSATAKKNLTEEATTAADGTPIIFEGEDDAMTSQISGVLLSKAQYDAFMLWFGKRHPIMVTDDLGRQAMIVPTKITPKRAWATQHHYRQTYTIDYLIAQQVNV